MAVQCSVMAIKDVADMVEVAPCHSVSGGSSYGSAGVRGSPWRLYSGFGGEKS